METEFEFELPRGYVDKNGDVHRRGTMRLATAADEILPLRGVFRRSSPSRYSTASTEELIPETSEKPARLMPSISTWYRNTLYG